MSVEPPQQLADGRIPEADDGFRVRSGDGFAVRRVDDARQLLLVVAQPDAHRAGCRVANAHCIGGLVAPIVQRERAAVGGDGEPSGVHRKDGRVLFVPTGDIQELCLGADVAARIEELLAVRREDDRVIARCRRQQPARRCIPQPDLPVIGAGCCEQLAVRRIGDITNRAPVPEPQRTHPRNRAGRQRIAVRVAGHGFHSIRRRLLAPLDPRLVGLRHWRCIAIGKRTAPPTSANSASTSLAPIFHCVAGIPRSAGSAITTTWAGTVFAGAVVNAIADCTAVSLSAVDSAADAVWPIPTTASAAGRVNPRRAKRSRSRAPTPRAGP